MKLWQKILLGLLVIFILLQFVPIDHSIPTVDPNHDYVQMEQPPAAVGKMIKDACYDCHSYETKYPWYASVAPLSFWLQGHINNGRKELNFSTWKTAENKAHKLEECAEEIEELKMPLKSYTWTHPEAKLTEAQKKELIAWFEKK